VTSEAAAMSHLGFVDRSICQLNDKLEKY
jgi:hypothetical protein